MIETIKRLWLPASGSVSSITLTAIETPLTINIHFIFYYLLVGIVGALGGLLVKIAWGTLKRKYPTLKNLDK